MVSVEEKREANLEKKEEERKAKNAAIAAKKKEQQAARGQAKKDDEAKAAQEKEDKEKLNAKREANIKQKQAKQKQGGTTISKKDVIELKQVFDECDPNKDGTIEMQEFQKYLQKLKNKRPATSAEKAGVSILDMGESSFSAMDKDGDGSVTFKEMLQLMYPNKPDSQYLAMMEYVAEAPAPEPEPEPGLSQASKDAINATFKLYDKDKSGSLTFKELKEAMKNTGVDADELKTMIKEFDLDENGEISKEEFQQLMASTGAYDD